jgi:uncharacterized hydrophobic protein (TIGR00271 family)
MAKNSTDSSHEDEKQVVHELIQQSHIGDDYYFMLIISTLITTLGLTIGNAAVVIGGMLIAPLLSPILALGLGLVTANHESLMRSSINILKSAGVVLGLSFVMAFILGIEFPANQEILSRIQPTLTYMWIALLSGIAATYSWARSKLSAMLPGVAVVVALLPPLCTVGIGIALLDKEIITGAFQLFLVNLVGIATSSAIVFSLLGYHQMRRVEKRELDQEKKEESSDENQR